MFVVREINIEYKSPARFESEINISIDKIEIKDPFIVFYQTVSNVEDMKTLVKVIVHCVCVDGNFKLLKKIPDIVRKLIL
jgi:acyl-CoA thioesterase FadM